MAGTLTKDQILDGIAELSVLELSELLKEFEEKFGVTAAAPMAVAMAAPADRADNIYMDAGNYSRSWDQPIVTSERLVTRKFDMKGWLFLLLGRHSAT